MANILDIKEKQQYLCDNILDKEYDPEQFSQFMQNIRENGGDVGVWTLEELKTVVVSFQEDARNNYQLDYSKVQDRLNNLSFNFLKQSNQGSLEEDDKNFKKVLKCQIALENQISVCEDLCIEVLRYEKKSGGIFSSSFIAFEIKTSPLNVSVFRRYKDFQWLHSTLEKIFPQIYIPPIPSKQKTKTYQQISLSNLIQSPEIKKSKFLLGFLTLQNEDDFLKLVKEGDKINRSSNITQMITETGEIQCQINPEINNFIKKSSDYIHHQEIIYKKTRSLYAQLITQFDQLSVTLYNIGECFSQSYNITQIYNGTIEEKGLEDIYLNLNNMSISWGNNITAQVKLTQENLSNWFKYYDNELISLKEKMKFREQTEKEYTFSKQKLNSKKEKLFSSGQVSKWDISSAEIQKLGSSIKIREVAFANMLPKESSTLSELRDLYGFFNYSCYSELKRIFARKVENFSRHFNQFGQFQSDHIQEMHVLWADLMANMQGIGKCQNSKGLLECLKVNESILTENQNCEYD